MSSVVDLLARLFGADGERFNRAELYLRELPTSVLVVLCLAVVASVVAHAWAVSQETRAPRVRLVMLRTVAALLLLLIILGPSIELQNATRVVPRVAILLDSSKSMGLDAEDGTRLEHGVDIARSVIDGLGDRFEIEVARFDREVTPLAPVGLESVTASGLRTDIASALAALKERDEDGRLAGVVLITDGGDTRLLGEPRDVGRQVGNWPKVPVFPVPVADPAGFRDVALVDPRHDDFGFVRHELTFEVQVLVRGFAGNEVTVVLRRDGSPVTTRRVVATGKSSTLPVSFAVTPTRPGTYVYSIEARPLPGELVLDNNKYEFAVKVGRDQLRVLMICGRPSWDERFLRQLLKKDPNVDLVSFFILRDVQDVTGVPMDELSLIPFPVNDLFTTELENFDVVILQNFDRRPFLSQLHLENLREFVTEGGGGLLMIGGDIGMIDGGYAGSAIEGILPFSLTPVGPRVDESSFRARVTDAGQRHFITRLEPNGARNREIYANLPHLDGVNLVGPLHPHGVALLTHPSQSVGGLPMPVVATSNAGKGRTMAVTADTTWYWNFKAVGQGGSNRHYLQFWQNAVRWLTHDPSSKFLQLEVGEAVVTPGTTAELRVRAFRGDYGPLPGGRIRTYVRRTADRQAPSLLAEGVTDATGGFRAEIVTAEEGFYHASVELLDAIGEVVDRDERVFEVRTDRTELNDPAVRGDLLEAIASATGGRMLEAKDARHAPIPDPELYRLKERRRIDLWDNLVVFLLLLTCLTAEWWLRRRSGFA